MVFYQVSNSKKGLHGEVWLGFSIRGIVVFDVHKEVRTPVLRSAWSTTENITYSVSKNGRYNVCNNQSVNFVAISNVE